MRAILRSLLPLYQVAAAVIALQQRLPRARVVYCSATGVSEIGAFAYSDAKISESDC